MQQTKTEKTPRTLDNVVGGPYTFKLKDGTLLGLGEWTIAAEKWAKVHFGGMKELYQSLMYADGDDEKCINAAIQVAAYKLDEDSRRKVDERLKAQQSTEEFIAENLKYSDFAILCKSIFSMIRDSMPLDMIDKIKKNMIQDAETAAAKTTTKTQGKMK